MTHEQVVDEPVATRHGLSLNDFEALLCAFASVHTDLNAIDWKEAGVSREKFAHWWRATSAFRRRRKAEEKRLAAVALAEDVLARLTPAERKALRDHRDKW